MTKKKLFEAFETALEELYESQVEECDKRWGEEPESSDDFKMNQCPYELTDYSDEAVMKFYRHLEPYAFEKYGDAYDEILTRHIIRLAIQFLRSDYDLYDIAHDYFDGKARQNGFKYYGVSKSNFYGVK